MSESNSYFTEPLYANECYLREPGIAVSVYLLLEGKDFSNLADFLSW